jgi:hypothetical protein
VCHTGYGSSSHVRTLAASGRGKGNIPDDHLLRITKKMIVEIVNDQPHYSNYEELIPSFSDISCEIAGWCRYSDLEEVTKIPGQEFDGGTRFVRASGLLKKSKKDWKELIKQL